MVAPQAEAAIGIVVNPQTVLCKRGEITRVRVYVDLYEGSELIPYNDEQRGLMSCSTLTDSGRYITETIRWDFGIDTDGRFYYIITCDGSADEDVRVPFRITYKGKEYPSQLTVRTIGSGRGAVLRGPQDWEKCAVGYEFQNGAEGYDFYDVVIYEGKFYTCSKAHSKTLLNKPGGTYSENNGLWKQTWNMEAVATTLLLAKYALIENLGVSSVEMKDTDGNVLCSIKDGEVVCRTGTFENVNVSGELTADCLNLKKSTKAHAVGVPELPDGAICVNASALILPALEPGAVRTIRVLNPMRSKLDAEDLVLRPASGKVKIQSDWSGTMLGGVQVTLPGKGYNGNSYFELIGYRHADNDDTTYWLVSEMNNGLIDK